MATRFCCNFLVTSLGLGMSLVLACGGGSGGTKSTGAGGAGGGGGGTSGDPQLDAFCKAAHTIGVDQLVSCTGILRTLAEQYENIDTCAALKTGVAAGSMWFNPDHADACLSALRSMSCEAVAVPAVCDSTIWGQVKEGGTCNDARSQLFFSECETGTYCIPSGNGCTGTCTKLKLLNQDCSSVPCTQGETCNTSTHLCVEEGAQGDACGHTSGMTDCGEGLYCSDLWEGECVPKHSSGACSDPDECAPPTFCDRGLDISGTCSLRKKPGDPCTASSYDCGGGMHCNAGGACQLDAGLGKPCGQNDGTDGEVVGEEVGCIVGLCDTSGTSPTCKLIPSGSPCSYTSDCGPNALCSDAGTCTAACF